MNAHVFNPAIVQSLLADPVVSGASYEVLARLLPHLVERTFAPGEALFSAGEPASTLYVVTSGRIVVADGRGRRVLEAPCRTGDEAATDFVDYIGSVRAEGAVTAIAIPRSALVPVISSAPKLKVEFYYALVDGKVVPNAVTPSKTAPSAKSRMKQPSLREVVGWGLTVLLPALMLVLGGPMTGLAREPVMFLAVFSAVLVMWVFTLVDDFVPCIFALLACLVLGLAPPQVVLSGFSSDGFLMAMSILGLGTVITASGLSYRFLLYVLLRVPNSRFWHNLVLMVTGMLLTPLVPSINGRVGLMVPSLIDLVEELRIKPGGPVATRLSMGMFTGVSLLSAVFMSSKSVNFVIFGLLPAQDQDVFQWSYWLFAASVAGLVMLACYFLVDLVFTEKEAGCVLSKEQVRAQLEMLGVVRNREWAAIAGVAVFVLGVATASIHKIAPPWLGMAILYGLLLLGFLRKKEFREHIDWPFLVYLAGSVGIISTFNHLGLDKLMAPHVTWFSTYMHEEFGIFLALLAVVVFLIRLVVPISATIVLLSAIFIPVAAVGGVNPWVVGFAILTLGEMWFLPYQCSYYLQMRETAYSRGIYDEKRFLAMNGVMNLARLAALYASIPFWNVLGLL